MPDTDTQNLTGQAALHFIEEQFRQQKLVLPPIPAEFVPSLRMISESAVGSASVAEGLSLYDIDNFVDAATTSADSVFAGFAGRGFTSWGAHFYLIQGPLRVFIQLHWGSPYAEEDVAAAKIEGSFGLAETLIADVKRARETGKFPVGSSLSVVQSDFGTSRWGWTTAEGTEWEESSMAIFDAACAVKDLID